MGEKLAKEVMNALPQGRQVVADVTKKLRDTKGMTLKGYCNQCGLSYNSLCVGFISKKAAMQFISDGLV